jgi:pimeloyl-ACP methyl ester carboxylesterase
MTGPVSLAAMGSFTVGGREVQVSGQPVRHAQLSAGPAVFDPNGTYHVDHAYVQYFLPAQQRGLPVVLVHGGGLTGSCWDGTPDGRPGWAWRFLGRGHPVYVIDNVERGRAGWNTLAGVTVGQDPQVRPDEEAWTVYRIGPADGFTERRAYPGGRFPVGHFAEACRQIVPRWLTTTGAHIAALEALFERLGRCLVVAHSQGGGIAAHAAARQPGRVAALALLEPHSLPGRGDGDIAAAPQLIVAGDFIGAAPVYHGLSETWRGYLDTVTRAGGRGDYYDLPALGHPGNSHMLMMDENSDAVADIVAGWLSEAGGA